MSAEEIKKKICILPNGPYRVEGPVPIFVYEQEMSPRGEPLSWINQGEITPAKSPYLLCRCGRSKTFPFCDHSHTEFPFDGRETFPTHIVLKPNISYYANDGLTISKFLPLCMTSGFCVRVDGSVDSFSEFSDDPEDHKIAIKMAEDCPAGALVYRFSPQGPDLEKEYPMQIALIREGVEDEMINGPFWVMGYLPIERSDQVPFLPRNRVTLCACGQSHQKPLCDGTHRLCAERRISRQRRQDSGPHL